MRKQKLLYNTISSLVFQIVTIISGFILPRLILDAFGSDVNGLVSSITQFLGIIAFLELGVGAVVQSSLYKPLAEKNYESVSEIFTSANRFFTKLGIILIVYVASLIFIYPLFLNKQFDWIFTSTLIIAMSISSFAQYFCGIVNRLLLTADQRGYVQYSAQTLAIIVNTIACYVLIVLGAGIQIVKLTTSLIFLIQPILLYFYVNKHYQINRHAKYTVEPITQKWNGIAQHVAAVVLDNTDTIVLTIFSTLSNVSIYSVYFLVVKGVKQLFMSMTNGITSLIGELWAKQEIDELKKMFSWTEWLIHTGTTLVFGITALLIVPFVRIYTYGINDADYIQPLFASLLVAANAGHCLRLPYNIMILAGGHYKQTQNNYLIAAFMNIVVSVLTVKKLGLIGVAIGTLVAMIFQTVWMAWYDSRNLIKWPFINFVKQCIVDFLTILFMVIASKLYILTPKTYGEWILLSIPIFLISLLISIIVNLLFYKEKIILLKNKILQRFIKN